MSRRALIIVALLTLTPGACANWEEIPHESVIYNNMRIDGDFNPANSAKAIISGRGCIRMVIGMAAWGDAGAGRIAYDSGIKRIARIDHHYFSVLGVYNSYCTIVYGEE